MKLSEMAPDVEPLHGYFRDVAVEFEKREVWKKFLETHFSFEIEGDEEKVFRYFKYVKNKVQIFRDYGDLQQTERSNDPQTYAAPEGQVELEIRPERVDGVKIPRPRCNVYVPNMIPKKEEFEGGYSHRQPTDCELKILTQVAMAGDKLKEFKPSPDVAATESLHQKIPDSTRVIYKPFKVTIEIKSFPQTEEVTKVTIWTPPTVPPVMRKCEFCSRRREEMSRCAGCKVAYYCCVAHQKLDWKGGHKKSCCAQKNEVLEEVAKPYVDITGDAPWKFLQPNLEEFHGGNDVKFTSNDYLKPVGFADVKFPAEFGTAPVTWDGVYAVLGLDPMGVQAVALSDVLTVYSVVKRLKLDEKEEVTIHVADACLEPTVLETFSLLSVLLPSTKVKLVMVGRRMPTELHYAVYSWRESGWGGVCAEPTGVMGDVWRGRCDDKVAVRFYSDDYAGFVKKNGGECDAVVLLNALHSRHSFFHSTTHTCVQLIAKGVPVLFAAYSQYTAEQIIAAFTEVNAKEAEKGVKLAMPAPFPPTLNPFRSPYKERTEMPIPCYANMFVSGWV